MIKTEGEWRRFVLRALVLSGLVLVASFVGNRLANARDGVAGGAARSSLTVSGTLTGVTGPQTATFRFYRGMTGGEALCAPEVMITDRDETTGAFSVEVPLDQMGRVCPNALFDGSDVYVEVQVGTRVVVQRRAINPVPYAHYASVAGQVGVSNDCPAGYERGSLSTDAPGIVCVRNVVLGALSVRDEVVKVGVGSAAFWVDRYESAIFLRADGMQLGAANTTGGGADNIASVSGLQRSGQHPRGPSPVVALSRLGMPTVNVTWFQANEACRFSGKRLMVGSEWLAAAVGTPDATCNVNPAGGVQMPSPTTPCVSSAGALGMVGNVDEWTDEWYSGVGVVTTPTGIVSAPDAGVASVLRPLGSDGERVEGLRANLAQRPWPSDYGDGRDRTDDVVAAVIRANGEAPIMGLPAVAHRGGAFSGNDGAGVYAFDLESAPTFWHPHVGFRCMIPR